MNVAEKVLNLSIAEDFSRTPGPRFRSEGKFSGEQFRDEVLQKHFDQATSSGAKLHVDLDGGYGYAPSFLEEAFGGLARIYGSSKVAETLTFKSDEEPGLIDDIVGYIRKIQ
jgi:STAS-like domain of unknown function (DUF4325)